MNRHDLISREDAIRKWMRDFFLDTSAWDAVPVVLPKPRWKSVPYTEQSSGLLPKKPGLYAFLLRPKPGLIPAHGYLLYVGKTGDGQSSATLKDRFQQYLREQGKDDGRSTIRSMLIRWETHLHFSFIPIAKSKKHTIGPLETALIKATLPWANKAIADADLRYAAGPAFPR